jgi:hypothetical protein
VNPYFITDPAGTRYLDAARQKALFPEIMPRQDWSASQTAPDLLRTVADLIRTLPEFRESGGSRIEEVSQQLAQTISQSAGKGDGPSRPRRGHSWLVNLWTLVSLSLASKRFLTHHRAIEGPFSRI